MKRTVRIAVIGFTTLENIGLKSLLDCHDDVACEVLGSSGERLEDMKDFDGFIASADAVGMAPDFFMRFRGRLLIIGDISYSSLNTDLMIADKEGDEAEIVSSIERLIESLRKTDTTDALSSREKEVLKLVAQGNINKEIADRLCISINTVITHRKNIASKLGIKSASGLSLYAMMHGLLEG